MVTLISFILTLQNLFAADLLKDFESLGGNQSLYEKAKALNPESDVSVVQGRIVDRRLRHEIDLNMGNYISGNPYMNTDVLGLGYQFHISPKWSVNLQGSYFFNNFSKEAKNLIYNDFKVGSVGSDTGLVPAIDWQKNSYELNINYYPLYGKFSFFDFSIVHFDLYGILGAGQTTLARSGQKFMYNYGAGLGLWLSQHLSARLEFKVNNFEAEIFAKKIDYSPKQLSMTVGWLL